MTDNYLGKEIGKLALVLCGCREKAMILTELINRMADRYLEAGFTYFDTAYVYTVGRSHGKTLLNAIHGKYQIFQIMLNVQNGGYAGSI